MPREHQAGAGGWWGKEQEARDISLQEVTDKGVPSRSVHAQGWEIQQGPCRGGARRGAKFLPPSLWPLVTVSCGSLFPCLFTSLRAALSSLESS